MRPSDYRVIIDEFIEAVETRSSVAVELVPPHTHEVFLMEDCTVGTQEVVCFVVGANMESLALCLHISIVTGEGLLIA